jgi:hypothetical protein|tara:strand:+ start:1273 stop:1542 length:270 start_codon:yes stop_codon:yes gene_type:complete
MFLKPKSPTIATNSQMAQEMPKTPDENRRAAISDVIKQSYAREVKLRQSKDAPIAPEVLKQKEQMAQQQAQQQSGGGLKDIFNMFLGAS